MSFISKASDALSPDFMGGGGECGALLRAQDWSRSPLGPPEAWPEVLKTLLALMHASNQPMFTVWGPRRITLYNDAYAEILAGKHPAMAMPFEEIWPEIWARDLEPIVTRAYAGEPIQMDDIELVMMRKGYPEETHFSFSYTPVRLPDGRVEGFFCPCFEITESILEERRNQMRAELTDRLRDQENPALIGKAASEVLGRGLGVDLVACYGVNARGSLEAVAEWTAEGAPCSDATAAVARLEPGWGELERGRRVVRPADAGAPKAGPDSAEGGASDDQPCWVAVPMMKAGRLVGILLACQAAPLQWSEVNLARIEEFAERTRALIEGSDARRALRESEARLATIMTYAPVGIGLVDAEGRWTFTNPRLTSLVGEVIPSRSPELRERWAAFDADGEPIPPSRWPAERALAGEIVAPGVDFRVEIDGQTRWLQVTTAPVSANASADRAVFILDDVTERRTAAQRLRESERRHRALVEGIPQLVWRAVDHGQWTWSSPQWTAQTGLALEASLGYGWLEAVHPEDREKVRAEWANARGNAPPEMDQRLRDASGGYRWFRSRATPVLDGRGRTVEWLGTSTDVDELRRLQDQQKVMVRELQHRTRNLIAVVQSIASQALRSSASLGEFKERFNDRLASLSRVQGLLSRADLGATDIGRIVRMELEALGAEHNGATVDLAGPTIRVPSSIVQTLALALHELATNARKYGALSNGTGALRVRWDEAGGGSEDRRVRIDWTETGIKVRTDELKAGGYGRSLIERGLPYTTGATTSYELGADGLHCSIEIPLHCDGAEPRGRKA